MKFNFDALVIWLKNGKIRTLNFLPNKVNVVTGDSNTGKTAILEIIDYCLFASRHRISDSMINENVEWYGIKFSINGKVYLIARHAPAGNQVSSDYYFSSVGEIPEGRLASNITEGALKILLEADFGIDRDIKVSYGGKILKANSRISLRYFLVLNTISQDIITHSEEYFDKQSSERYREALPRTFDLAVGIDTVGNILKREKREELDRELKKLEREGDRVDRKKNVFYEQLSSVVRTAKEYALLPEDTDLENSISFLSDMVSRSEADTSRGAGNEHRDISASINEIERKIRNLHRFSQEYNTYKSSLKEASDSLKPLDFIEQRYSEIIKTSIYEGIVASLKSDHLRIRRSIVNRTPLESNVSDIIKGYEIKLKGLREEEALLPKNVKTFKDDREKYIFLGEIKTKLDVFGDRAQTAPTESVSKLERLRSDIELLTVESAEERRAVFINVLDETIQEYIADTKSALENYGEYRSSFNYQEKKLQLRKPKTDFIENVGSSSNHMFLHLFLFLGLHSVIIRRKVPFVPPFLIIDQFSRPYWGDGDQRKKVLDHTDVAKVKSALKLLNGFIQNINDSGSSFQMIVFEHVNKEHWEGLAHIHLVENFQDGNALIPERMLN